jgi:hypothetical protein
MNSDRDKSYTKIIAFVKSYNFVVHNFSFEIILMLKYLTLYTDLSFNDFLSRQHIFKES